MKAKFPQFWSKSLEDQFYINIALLEATEGVLVVVEILERPQTQFAKYKRQIAKVDENAARIEGCRAFQLGLMSKHASLKEARVRTLMSAAVIGFTIITIVFTPLAFLASLFALSTNQFQKHQHNSTQESGPPFYENSYVAKCMG